MRYIKHRKIDSSNFTARLYSWFHNTPYSLQFRMELEYKFDHCRFDAIIHNDKDILCIIETKNALKKDYYGEKPYVTKQLNKYLKYGIPVFVLNGENGLTITKNNIVSLLGEK